MGSKTQPHVQSNWVLDQPLPGYGTVTTTIMTTLSLSLLDLSL